MRRLGRKHWVGLPWKTHSIGQDEEFKTLEAPDIEQETAASLEPIDDLAIVVLFSVFESLVRSHVVQIIGPEASELVDPILKHAAEDAIQGVQEGSFYGRVLEPLRKQGRVSADLVTKVNQVRDYRNWVAHGRRDRPKNNIAPSKAYERLKDFLNALGIAVEAELIEPEN